MKYEKKVYDPDYFKEKAMLLGFDIEYNPLKESDILFRDTIIDRLFFQFSGGKGLKYLGLIHPSIEGILRERLEKSAYEAWTSDYGSAWTLLREKENKTEFIDYYVCSLGEQRFTAGTFEDNLRFPEVPKVTKDLINCKLDRFRTSTYASATGIMDLENIVFNPITKEDNRVLELRDYRWDNYENTKIKLDMQLAGTMMFGLSLVGGCGGMMSGLLLGSSLYPEAELEICNIFASVGGILGVGAGITYCIQKMKNFKKEKRAKNLSLNNVLFNEDVIKYLDLN